MPFLGRFHDCKNYHPEKFLKFWKIFTPTSTAHTHTHTPSHLYDIIYAWPLNLKGSLLSYFRLGKETMLKKDEKNEDTRNMKRQEERIK